MKDLWDAVEAAVTTKELNAIIGLIPNAASLNKNIEKLLTLSKLYGALFSDANSERVATFVEAAEKAGQILAHLDDTQPKASLALAEAQLASSRKAAAEDGTFRSADELKELYANAGISGDKPIIAYCRIGERSSHSWFVLTQLLGYNRVRNYDGSWTEYGSLVGVPVER